VQPPAASSIVTSFLIAAIIPVASYDLSRLVQLSIVTNQQGVLFLSSCAADNYTQYPKQQIMSTVTKAVRFLSSIHGTKTALRMGETSVDDLVRQSVFSPKYFPAFLAVSMTGSGVAGFYFMDNLRRQRQNLHGVTSMVVVRN
jgi:hypothetical protein